MSRYKSNLFANFAGAGSAALLQLVFIPFYVRFLGIEAYGLIGFQVMLLSVSQLLDLGLGPTMNREMARYSVSPGNAGEARDFARTLEILYWALGVAAGAAIVSAAPLIAARWVNIGTLPLPTVSRALALMGVLVSLQFPMAFYQGGLMGLQRQVLFNAVRVLMSALSSGGAVLVLWLFSPTITAFFAWQAAVAALQAAVLCRSLWICIPRAAGRPRFSPGLLGNSWRFAAGMSGIAVCSIVLTQMDKVLLSKLLPLKTFGYYTLATVAANGLLVLIQPVFNATFPRLSAMVAARDGEEVRNLYHRASQLIAALVLPAAAVLSLFPEEALFAWTGDAEAARAAAPIARFLVLGTALNGILTVPYALQLAHGWTKLALLLSVFLIVTMAPAIYAATLRYGAVGAASIWLLLNLVNLAVAVPLTHGKLLPGDTRRWLLADIALPLGASALVVGIARGLFAGYPASRLAAALGLAGLLAVALALSTAATPVLRTWMREQWEECRKLHA